MLLLLLSNRGGEHSAGRLDAGGVGLNRGGGGETSLILLLRPTCIKRGSSSIWALVLLSSPLAVWLSGQTTIRDSNPLLLLHCCCALIVAVVEIELVRAEEQPPRPPALSELLLPRW